LTVGIVFSDKLKDYDFGPGHPFRSNRFSSFMSFFDKKLMNRGFFKVIFNDETATNEELMLWHTKKYINAVEKSSKGFLVPDLFRYISGDNVNPLTGNFPLGVESAARVIVKNALLASNFVLEKRFEKCVSIGGGLHHAKPNFGEGFCVYNDVVICCRYV
jgi:acetoin utilization protein AcuC